MQLATDSEVGELYTDGQGRVVFRNRQAIFTRPGSVTAQGIFGDGTSAVTVSGFPLDEAGAGILAEDGYPLGAEDATSTVTLACTALTRPSDDTTLANDVQAAIVGGTVQEVKDTGSVAAYLFPRTYSREDLILQTDAAALQWASYVLYLAKNSEFRIDQVTITPGNDPDGLFPQALGRDFADRITVWKQPPNVSAYSADLFIRGIEHDFSPAWWQTTWTTQSADRFGGFFTLDDATYGVLDTGILAY